MTKRIGLAILAALLAGLPIWAQAPEPPQQVSVSAKIVEFQTTKNVDTGLSAYLKQMSRIGNYGRIETPSGAITTADLTFPNDSASGLSVFLDQIHIGEYDLEIVLQALAAENRAYILSRPKVMAMFTVPTTIKTVVTVPYEETVVVGNTPVQTTKEKETGVVLTVNPLKIVDDDGNWNTPNDTYIQLNVVTDVKELGQRLVVKLDDRLAGGSDFSLANNGITAPEFVSRSMNTTVWVRHGQVLVLGGLFRNTKNKSLETLPWLAQAEDTAVALAERVVPGSFLGSPISASLGNRSTEDGRRELVFFIKVEAWRPSYTLSEHGFNDAEEKPKEKMRPTDVISDVIEGITQVPKGIAEGITGQDTTPEGVAGELGGME
ncbi:MAG: hypothetical protein RBU21_21515 [FCB group bacterium]|jgi:hypothetical protein|nr:hypothetical protein [FCB group bacterium]